MPIGFNHNSQNINTSEEIVLQTGSIFGNGRSSAPAGYLLCDGSAISRTTYANLFNAIGTSFGTGNGSTTFNIPDGRGGVLRGAGTSIGYNQNVTVTLGTKDNDTMQGHWHSPVQGDTHPHDSGVGGGILITRDSPSAGNYNINSGIAKTIVSDTVNGTPRLGNETKMKNIGVNFFIKF